MGIGNSFSDVVLKSSSEFSAEVQSWQISISRPSLGEDSKSPSVSLFSLELDEDADSSNLLIPPLVGIEKLLLSMDVAFAFLANDGDVTLVDMTGASSNVVDVDQREGSDSDEGEEVIRGLDFFSGLSTRLRSLL